MFCPVAVTEDGPLYVEGELEEEGDEERVEESVEEGEHRVVISSFICCLLNLR